MTILTEKQKNMAEILVGKAKSKDVATFLEIEEETGIDRRGIGTQVGRISRRCKELGLPLISVLVVSSVDQKTPNGFSKEFYPDSKEENDEVCRKEKEKVYAQNDWSALLDWGTYDNVYPDEEKFSLVTIEGKKKTVKITQYERNPKLRRACIEKYGTTCAICGFDAVKTYGEEFKGKIHIHHIVPLNKTGEKEMSEDDLRPVCPNCHMILHSKGNGEVYTIEEVRKMIDLHK